MQMWGSFCPCYCCWKLLVFSLMEMTLEDGVYNLMGIFLAVIYLFRSFGWKGRIKVWWFLIRK